jgi:hypothetical protein
MRSHGSALVLATVIVVYGARFFTTHYIRMLSVNTSVKKVRNRVKGSIMAATVGSR